MSDLRSIPDRREVSALCAAVRAGGLDNEQREYLAQLLERTAAATLGCWDPLPTRTRRFWTCACPWLRRRRAVRRELRPRDE